MLVRRKRERENTKETEIEERERLMEEKEQKRNRESESERIEPGKKERESLAKKNTAAKDRLVVFLPFFLF